MSTQVINGNICIARSSDGNVYIKIEDRDSNIQFAELKLTAQQFGECVTGLYTTEVPIEVRGLHNVGKVKVSEARVVTLNVDSYDKEIIHKALAEWHMKHDAPQGWSASMYLGSQNSIGRQGGMTTVRYSVYKFVDKEDE